MRKTISAALLAASLFSSAVALADEPPPPPPPPPPSETGSSESGSGGSAMRQGDGLFDTSSHHRSMMVSGFVGLPYGFYGGCYGGYCGGSIGFGLGGRFYIPIMHDGFVPAINDEFGIEFGIDFMPEFFNGGSIFAFDIPVQVMYDVHLVPKFDVYAKLGIAPAFYFGTYSGFYPYSIFAASVGLRFRVTDSLYLRAEAGWPMLMVGLGFTI